MKMIALSALLVGAGLLAAGGAEAKPVKPAFREAAIQQCKINRMNNKPLSSQCRALLHVRPHHHVRKHKPMSPAKTMSPTKPMNSTM